MVGGSRDAILGWLTKTRQALTVLDCLESDFMPQRVVVHGLHKLVRVSYQTENFDPIEQPYYTWSG